MSGIESAHGLSIHGITSPGTVHWNLDWQSLREMAIAAGEGKLTTTGALSCTTGEFTGRSPQDKFIVEDVITKNEVDWGKVNRPLSPAQFAELRRDQLEYLSGKTLFVRDAFGGADPMYQLPIRVINESAWANLFCRQLFLRPSESELKNHLPQFTIIHTPGFSADPAKHGTRTGTFIVINFTEGLVLIGGTQYAGEMKKSIFSVLNFLYPRRGVMPMHCSANIAATGEERAALFFGLSGTGKTTLSADPERKLVGDDEHGWSDHGIFNFEGGCYAKCINLSAASEPEIFNAIRDGAILENVVLDSAGVPDYTDITLTENTRAAYPIDYIGCALAKSVASHPKNIIFLTCDAFGVMPPIAKLTPVQAMYHFLSGYTAKVAGTEKGMGNTPQATFSACFGAPFLPLAPTRYAQMLGERIENHKVDCWLLNTGWIGGAFGVGKRISLKYTRQLVTAAVNGQLKSLEFAPDPVFGFDVPKEVNDIPKEILSPRTQWQDPAAYDAQALDLARRFKENFENFATARPDLVGGGPIV